MRIGRREFVGALAATGLSAEVLPLRAARGPQLRLGVLSDIHVTTPECAAHDEHAQVCLKTPAAFERALVYFREQGVDAVVIAGDLTEFGLLPELRRVAAIWRKVFPDDRGTDGEKVEKLFILGNHDAIAWRWISTWTGDEWEGAERKAHWDVSIAKDPAAAWRECFREEYAPIRMKTVKGVRFILASWPPLPEGERNWRGGADVPGIADYLAAHRTELSDGHPFFYVQHAHPKGTCVPFACGDSGTSTAALKAFPNAIALSGHAHQPLTDERNVWQGEFTSIGTASLIDAGGRSFRENGSPYAKGMSRFARMPYLRTGECRHGMYIRLEGGRLEIRRRDFNWGVSIGSDWSVPLDGSRAFAFAPRAAVARKPAFAADASTRILFKKKDGKTVDGNPMPRIEVSFPAADCGGRVYDYEVRAVVEADDHEQIVCTKRILAPDYHLPESKTGRGGSVWFADCELPKDAVRFDILPVDCFGNRGSGISALYKE